GELAPELPLAQAEEELLAGRLVDRVCGGPRVELGEQGHELVVRLLAAGDEVGAQPAVEVGVEMVRRELLEQAHELRMGDAAGERLALQPLARVDQPRRGGRTRRGAPGRA